MNLHEYQGKEILESFGVRTPMGRVATTVEEAVEQAKIIFEKTKTKRCVLKAQIHAGGRGKGGGVKVAHNLQEVQDFANQIIGMQLITPQTSKQGKKVNQILIVEDVFYLGQNQPKEYYISILLNRNTGKNMIMYSTEGGMDIETVAKNTPHLIFTQEIDSSLGLLAFQARNVAFDLGLTGDSFKEMVRFVTSLYEAYIGSDASLLEINPVVKTSDGKILAADTKLTLDDNALFRHKDFLQLRDIREENPIEVYAKQAGLNYIALDGNVGCMVNGAGLAMATMDLIKQVGGEPANFLDVGGTADASRVETAFKIILKDPKVKAILVNIFGGIVRCDRVAQGIVDAYKNMGEIKVPIIVRLQGTNAELAKEIIDSSGLKVYSAIEFEQAANLVQQVLK